MSYGVYISLGAYFVLMLAIGYYCYLRADQNVAGFMLGGRKLGPAVTALSAGASDMSGWMLMGLPGYIYVSGLEGVWIAIGLTVGAYFNYVLIAPRIRQYTEQLSNAVTIPEYLERRFQDNSRIIRTLCAVVIIVFFGIYTTSGVVAGGKLFESSFGLSYELGLYVTAAVVVLYSAFGGFAAVSLTDFVQGTIMFVAMIVVPILTIMHVGGWSEVQTQVLAIDPNMLSINSIGVLAMISAAAWGLGYFGQPHIIVRFMAISSVDEIPTARRIGIGWMIFCLIGAMLVGLAGAAYVRSKGVQLDDPETIFIFLSNTLFHPLVTGFLLAAILAAIMSTISSQLLVTSSSLTEDIYYSLLRRSASESERLLIGRLSVVLVALFAVIMAHDRNSTILSLVSNAWAGFGAAFGPVLIMSLFWSGMTRIGAIAGMIAGAATVLIWIYAPFTIGGESPSSVMYEIVPGFIIGALVTYIVSLVTPKNNILQELKSGATIN
jgi:SSS family solute:Na+ symporter/sodium/proline symporter